MTMISCDSKRSFKNSLRNLTTDFLGEQLEELRVRHGTLSSTMVISVPEVRLAALGLELLEEDKKYLGTVHYFGWLLARIC